MILSALFLVVSSPGCAVAFTPPRPHGALLSGSPTVACSMSTVEAPPREDVDRTTRRRQGNNDNGDFLGDKEENIEDAMRTGGPLEYLEDSMESREMDDPFHILLMGETFDKPKITVTYVATSLTYVLDMPDGDANELSQSSHDNGMSCLGTWSREECLTLGRQLQVRDIVCRVVPYCEGGHRGWQAKDSFSSGGFANLRDAGAN